MMVTETIVAMAVKRTVKIIEVRELIVVTPNLVVMVVTVKETVAMAEVKAVIAETGVMVKARGTV